MIITNFHVQHILKSYSQQLSSKSRILKNRGPLGESQADQVNVSNEGKKLLLSDRIAQDIIDQMGKGSQENETTRTLLKQLGQEEGRNLSFSAQEGGGLAFQVMDETGQNVLERLSPQENERLGKKLLDLTKHYVQGQLL